MNFSRFAQKRTLKLTLLGLYFGLAVFAGYMIYGMVQSHTTVAKDTQSSSQASSSQARLSSISTYHLFGQPLEKIREIRQAPWKLKGIIVQADNTSVVIIEQNNREKLYAIGDKLDAKTLIKSIEKGKVLVLRDGKMQSLSIFKK